MRDRETQERYGPDVSRRSFLKGSGVAVAATAIASAAASVAPYCFSVAFNSSAEID